MKNFFKAARVGLMVMVCALFLGIGIKAEAASKLTVSQSRYGYNVVEIGWTDNDGSSGGYKIEYSENADMTRPKDPLYTTSNPVKIQSLDAGKSYYITVTAVDADKNEVAGTKSDVVEAVTAPMATVSNLKQIKADATKATLSWTAAAGANGYAIVYAANNVNAKVNEVLVKNSATTSELALAANTGYAAYVLPVRISASGFLAYGENKSQIIDMSTLPKKKIAKLTFVMGGLSKQLGDYTTNSSGKQAYFSMNGNNAAQGYECTVYNNKGKKMFTKEMQIVTSKLLKISHNKLGYGQFMKIKIRPYIIVDGKKAYGPYSADCWFAKEPKKNTPSLVNKTSISAGAKITWSKITGATKYVVYARKSSSSKWKKVGNTKGTSIVIKSIGGPLQSGVSYDYKIVAEKKVKGKTYKSDASWFDSFRPYTYTYYNYY